MEILQEYWGNMRAVSDEVIQYLVQKRSDIFGPDSKIEITKKISSEENVICIVIRYNQEDLAILLPEYDKYKQYTLQMGEIFCDMTSWYVRKIGYTNPKSISGIQTVFNGWAKMVSSALNIPVKKVKELMDFQVIYTDLKRQELRKSRKEMSSEYRSMGYDVGPHGKLEYSKEIGVELLKKRLEDYIVDKMPSLDILYKYKDPEELIKNIKEFSIKRVKYILDDDNKINIVNLLSGNPVYLEYRREYSYSFNKWDMPQKIGMKLELQSGKIVITGVAGSRELFRGEWEPIDNWTFKPKVSESKVYKQQMNKIVHKYF